MGVILLRVGVAYSELGCGVAFCGRMRGALEESFVMRI
jgi:hypothetical protein